ncbi:MAG: hypothetical protein FD175_1492 [Beijerinckiaceae bacterium]|nr:MAG: hypothetical protein FD175_1492 [Beijerinckiaceae bacterium]
MPLLDAGGRFVADRFHRFNSGEATDHPCVLVSLADLPAVLAVRGDQEIGVEIANTVEIAALAPHFDALALIGIAFPAYADGRGFSLAKRLRRDGFTGTLRAIGPLIADQFAYALACGFDEVELPEANAARQPAEHWVKAAAAFSATYQRGYAREASILDQRRAARLEGRNG